MHNSHICTFIRCRCWWCRSRWRRRRHCPLSLSLSLFLTLFRSIHNHQAVRNGMLITLLIFFRSRLAFRLNVNVIIFYSYNSGLSVTFSVSVSVSMCMFTCSHMCSMCGACESESGQLKFKSFDIWQTLQKNTTQVQTRQQKPSNKHSNIGQMLAFQWCCYSTPTNNYRQWIAYRSFYMANYCYFCQFPISISIPHSSFVCIRCEPASWW